jgi:outer membrane protein assembly factor BamB
MKQISKVTILISLFAIGCKQENHENKNWDITIDEVYSASSPQAIDLNDDGIKDIVMGAGGQEWVHTKVGIVAINGADGSVMWSAPARNQIVGSALFLDINDDKTPDVIIGGREAELQALDGRNGKVIWKFFEKEGGMIARLEGLYNFYNPQLVLDQNQDGLRDILICNGGDALIPAGMKYRPTGSLMLIDGKTGKMIARDTMPDGQETYASPVCFDCELNKNPTFIFGSGGETRKGHLYKCKLSDLLSKNLKNAQIIDSTYEKGYIAPPILADFTGDKVLDLLINTAEGKTKLFDGVNNKLIWSVKCDSSEVFSQPAIGYFVGGDKTLDVFVNFAKGVYPTYISTEQWLINGKTGKVEKKYSELRFTYSSPLTIDLNGDGNDDVVMNMVKDSVILNRKKAFYELTTFDFKNNKTEFIGKRFNGACFASTPWFGDLDGDNKLDIIYSGSPATYSEFPGTTSFEKPIMNLSIHRMKMPLIPSKSVKWGNYMGQDSKSIY